MPDRFGFTIRFPEGWSEVPPTADAAPGARRRFVFAPAEAVTGEQVVKAIASIELRPRRGIDAEQLLARALSERSGPSSTGPGVAAAPGPSDGYSLWRRQADAVQLAGVASVVVHDVFRPTAGSTKALQQRLLVTYFPPSDDVAVQFSLSSPDLLAFDDFLADGLAIASTLRISPATEYRRPV